MRKGVKDHAVNAKMFMQRLSVAVSQKLLFAKCPIFAFTIEYRRFKRLTIQSKCKKVKN
jgi:hypothetical protein